MIMLPKPKAKPTSTRLMWFMSTLNAASMKQITAAIRNTKPKPALLSPILLVIAYFATGVPVTIVS